MFKLQSRLYHVVMHFKTSLWLILGNIHINIICSDHSLCSLLPIDWNSSRGGSPDLTVTAEGHMDTWPSADVPAANTSAGADGNASGKFSLHKLSNFQILIDIDTFFSPLTLSLFSSLSLSLSIYLSLSLF